MCLLGEDTEQLADHRFPGEGHGGEVLPDLPVFGAGQEDDIGAVGATAGAADLLVVGHRRTGCAQVNHESEVRFVKTHAECGGGHQRLDLIVEQGLFQAFAFPGLGAAGVGGHGPPHRVECISQVMGGGHGQAVDDAGALQLVEVGGKPRGACRGIREVHHREVERFPVEPTTQQTGVLPELGADILYYAVIGGRGGRQHRHARCQTRQQITDAAVIGAEIMTPVGDTVRLIHHHQSGLRGQAGQDGIPEIRVVEAFRGDQQHIDCACGHLRLDLIPVGHIRTVEGSRPDPGAFRRRDLVTHQRQQRRDDHRGTGSPGAQQLGGDEIDRGFTPAGALDHQHASALVDQGVNGHPLVIAEGGPGAGDTLQELVGFFSRCVHALHLTPWGGHGGTREGKASMDTGKAGP